MGFDAVRIAACVVLQLCVSNFYDSTVDLSGPEIVRLAATVCRVAVWADEKGDVVVLAGILDGEGYLQSVGQNQDRRRLEKYQPQPKGKMIYDRSSRSIRLF